MKSALICALFATSSLFACEDCLKAVESEIQIIEKSITVLTENGCGCSLDYQDYIYLTGFKAGLIAAKNFIKAEHEPE